MKRMHIRVRSSRLWIALILLTVVLATAGAARAQMGAAQTVEVSPGLNGAAGVGESLGGLYDLRWNTIDGGGVTFASGGAYRLGGTIGQADAGLLAGGQFTLRGGFWGGLPAMRYRVYLPVVLRL